MTELSENNIDMDIGADARALAIQIISTLVYVKETAAERLLKRAGVPNHMIRVFLTDRNPVTGRKRSKREAGEVIILELRNSIDEYNIIKNIISIAADWTDFYLANDEYAARAVVERAKDFLKNLFAIETRTQADAEARLKEKERRRLQDQEKIMAHHSALLLSQLDYAAISASPQERGYLLEDILNRTFDLHKIPVHKSFRRNDGGEQIDAAFELNGWFYIVECRWRQRLADIRQIDGLLGQVARSGKQTMGLFLSVEGWSENVIPLMKQNSEKSIFLMEGSDLRAVLDRKITLRDLLSKKIAALNFESEPYVNFMKIL